MLIPTNDPLSHRTASTGIIYLDHDSRVSAIDENDAGTEVLSVSSDSE